MTTQPGAQPAPILTRRRFVIGGSATVVASAAAVPRLASIVARHPRTAGFIVVVADVATIVAAAEFAADAGKWLVQTAPTVADMMTSAGFTDTIGSVVWETREALLIGCADPLKPMQGCAVVFDKGTGNVTQLLEANATHGVAGFARAMAALGRSANDVCDAVMPAASISFESGRAGALRPESPILTYVAAGGNVVRLELIKPSQNEADPGEVLVGAHVNERWLEVVVLVPGGSAA